MAVIEQLGFRICAAGLAAFLATTILGRVPKHPVPPLRIADAALCLDGMETEPYMDDQQATPIAATTYGGCLLPDGTVSV